MVLRKTVGAEEEVTHREMLQGKSTCRNAWGQTYMLQQNSVLSHVRLNEL